MRRRFNKFKPLLYCLLGVLVTSSFLLRAPSMKSAHASNGSITTDFAALTGSGSYNLLTTNDQAEFCYAYGVSSASNATHGMIPGNWGGSVPIVNRAILAYKIDAPSGTFKQLSFSMNALLNNFGDSKYHAKNFFDIFVGTEFEHTVEGLPDYRYCMYTPSQSFEHQVSPSNSFRNFDTFDCSNVVKGYSTAYIAIVINSATECDSGNRSTYMDGNNIKLEYIGTKIKYVSINYETGSSYYNVNYDIEGVTLSSQPTTILEGTSQNITVTVSDSSTYIAYIKQNGLYEHVEAYQTSYTFSLGGSGASSDINIEIKSTPVPGTYFNTTLTYDVDYRSIAQYDHSWGCYAWTFDNVLVDNTNASIANRGLTLKSGATSGDIKYGISNPDHTDLNYIYVEGNAKVSGSSSAKIVFSYTPDGVVKYPFLTLTPSTHASGASFSSYSHKFFGAGFGLTIEIYKSAGDNVYLNNLHFNAFKQNYPPRVLEDKMTYVHGEEDLKIPVDLNGEALFDIQVGRKYLATSERSVQTIDGQEYVVISNDILDTYDPDVYETKILTTGGLARLDLTITDKIVYPIKSNGVFTSTIGSGGGSYHNLAASDVDNLVSVTGGHASCNGNSEFGLIPGDWSETTAITSPIVLQYVYYNECPFSGKYNISSFNINIVGYLNNLSDNTYHYANYIQVYAGNANTSTYDKATLVAQYSMFNDGKTTTHQITPSNSWQDFGSVDLTRYALDQSPFKVFVVIHHATDIEDAGHKSEFMENGKFKIHYIGTRIASITANYVLTKDEVSIFIDNYMHTEISIDNHEDTGMCRGSNGYYAKAKTAFLSMSEKGRNSFMNDEEWLNMRLRYEAWARSNNDSDPFKKSSSQSATPFILINNDEDINGTMQLTIIIVSISVTILTSILTIMLVKNRKKQK